MILEAIMNADYDKSFERFSKEKIEEGSIVFLGDSIISNYDLNNYFDNKLLINRGIAGDTAEKMLKRVDQIIDIKPSIVIINAGSNDIVRTTNSTNEIVKTILKIKYELETNVKDIKVYILTLPPVLRDHEITQKNYMKHRTNDDINNINEELAVFTELIDTNSELQDSFGNLNLPYTTDGLHLTNEGYLLFSKIISSKVKELNIK